MKDSSKIDFSKGKRGPIVPLEPRKERITIRLDRDIVEHFREIVEKASGGNYQTLINDALRAYVDDQRLEKRLRRIMREEMLKVTSTQ